MFYDNLFMLYNSLIKVYIIIYKKISYGVWEYILYRIKIDRMIDSTSCSVTKYFMLYDDTNFLYENLSYFVYFGWILFHINLY